MKKRLTDGVSGWWVVTVDWDTAWLLGTADRRSTVGNTSDTVEWNVIMQRNLVEKSKHSNEVQYDSRWKAGLLFFRRCFCASTAPHIRRDLTLTNSSHWSPSWKINKIFHPFAYGISLSVVELGLLRLYYFVWMSHSAIVLTLSVRRPSKPITIIRRKSVLGSNQYSIINH